MQAAEQDFGLLAVGFVDIEVEPIARLGIGQGWQLGFVFFKFACGNFFRAFLITRVGQRILLAETQSKCLSRGKAESEKGKTAHRQLQSEKRLYFMGLQGGVQVSAV